MKHTATALLLIFAIALLLAPQLSASEKPLLLVTDREDNLLYFLDGETLQMIGRVRTGTRPQAIAVSPDRKTAYVSNIGDYRNTITVVDLIELVKIKDITPKPYFQPHDMAITADGKKLYVTCEANRVVVEMSLTTDKVLRAFDTNEKLTHMLALSPDEKTIYTANAAGGNVCIIDVESGKREKTLASGAGCEAIGVTPDGSEVWAANRRADTITIIDTKTRKVKQKIGCQGYPLRIKFIPDRERALVTCAAANRVTVFDIKTHEEVNKVPTKPVPVGIDVTPDGTRAFTANNGEPSVTVLDLEAMTAIKSFPIGKYPFAIVYVDSESNR